MTEPDPVERLRDKIVALWGKRARGDVSERVFQKESERLVVDLCRALVRTRAPEEEKILLEHHVIRAHTKLTGSVLREDEQEFISLLATEHRLFRLRAVLHPNQPILFRNHETDALEEMALGSLSRVVILTQRRPGEIAAGLVIALFAVLAHAWLQVTGVALFLLGIAGALHGLLLPTRWAEVLGRPGEDHPPLVIWALRKKSARALVRFLRHRISQR
jgi:hypothetical protein